MHFLLFAFLLLSLHLPAQRVDINSSDPNTTAILDVSSTTAGVLIPRMTTAQRTAIVNPANSLLVYDTDTKSFWYRESTAWSELGGGVGLKSLNGSSTFTPFNLNPRQYIWELNSAFGAQNTVSIPTTILSDLCGDDDGCKVTLIMSNWVNGSTPELAQQTYNFSYNAATGKWRSAPLHDAVAAIMGTDNNGSTENVMSIFNAVYFTDGSYVAGVSSDAAVGFGFMKWTGYPSTIIARLVIED